MRFWVFVRSFTERSRRGISVHRVSRHVSMRCLFFFQAEDGIRDYKVTGVQTCALPICATPHFWQPEANSMNIVVCVKQVPDTWAEKRLSADDKTVDREGVDAVMNELDEYAVEEALRIQEATGGPDSTTVTVLTMGPEKATQTIRKALSMGADQAVHLVDPALHGSCAVATSYAMSKALGTIEWDLVICGSEATDARTSLLPAMLAEQVGV